MCLLIFLSCILIMWISWLNWDPEVWFAWICLFSKIRMRYGVLGRRQWHPTPVLLPGKFHGWRSLEGCSPWGCKESDTTERLPFHFSLSCIGEGNGNPLPCSCLENPRDGEPGGLPSLGSHRVGHDWSDVAAAAAAKPYCSCNMHDTPQHLLYYGFSKFLPYQYFCVNFYFHFYFFLIVISHRIFQGSSDYTWFS